MKNVKVVLTTLVFALAITGAVVAKTNEKKRFTSTQGYFRNAANTAWVSVLLGSAGFDPQSGLNQAAIVDAAGGTSTVIYLTQGTSAPAEFIKP